MFCLFARCPAVCWGLNRGIADGKPCCDPGTEAAPARADDFVLFDMHVTAFANAYLNFVQSKLGRLREVRALLAEARCAAARLLTGRGVTSGAVVCVRVRV